MKGIILAAGRGSRMCELTRDRPKCLVHFQDRTLLDLQRSALTAAGMEEVGLVRGYRGECFDDLGLHCFENPRWSQTNMVASLQCAAAWLRAEPCIISYSDIFYSADTVRALAASGHAISIAYDPDWLRLWSRRFDDPLSDAETFRHEGGRLLDIGQKTSSLHEIQGQYMGLLRFTPEGFAQVEAHLSTVDADRLDMTTLLRQLLARDLRIGIVPVVGSWGEIDSDTDLAIYEQMIQEGSMTFPP